MIGFLWFIMVINLNVCFNKFTQKVGAGLQRVVHYTSMHQKAVVLSCLVFPGQCVEVVSHVQSSGQSGALALWDGCSLGLTFFSRIWTHVHFFYGLPKWTPIWYTTFDANCQETLVTQTPKLEESVGS